MEDSTKKQITPFGDYFGELNIEVIISQDGVRSYRICKNNLLITFL